MNDVYKGLRSTGRPLLIELHAKNWILIKIPMEIDLRRASSTLCQFRKGRGPVGVDNFCFKVGTSNGPIIPFHNIARVSVARANRDCGKAEIFSCSSFVVALSVSPSDSSFILLTSRETCITDISGKLYHITESLQVIGTRRQPTRKRKWKTPRLRCHSLSGCCGYMFWLAA